LEIRYYNSRAIIAKLFRKFYSITSLHRESAIEMRRFTDEVLRIHRAFKNLQVPIESWDPWLLDKLTSNLDVDSSKLWEAEQSAKDGR
jgi:ubiquitin C-terminal hydrolase